MNDKPKSGIVGEYLGYRIYASTSCTVRIRSRRHRKRRIDKKWLKRFGYKDVPRKELFIIKSERAIIGHPAVIDKLRQHIQEVNNARDV